MTEGADRAIDASTRERATSNARFFQISKSEHRARVLAWSVP